MQKEMLYWSVDMTIWWLENEMSNSEETKVAMKHLLSSSQNKNMLFLEKNMRMGFLLQAREMDNNIKMLSIRYYVTG